MFSQHSLNRPMQGKIVLISFTDCCRFASPAASQLLNLFHVRSGENKCRLRRRLFSFLFSQIAAASRHSLLCSFSICFMYARVKTNVAFGAACFPSSLQKENTRQRDYRVLEYMHI